MTNSKRRAGRGRKRRSQRTHDTAGHGGQAHGDTPRSRSRTRRATGRDAGAARRSNNPTGRGLVIARRDLPSASHMPTRDETSAGGLVVSGLAEAVRPGGSVDLSRIWVALIGRIDRRGRLLWSMPKGHVEEGEECARTAEREVWEETGVRGSVIGKLGTIDYWFVSDGVRIHKTVHHHLLRYVDGDFNDEDPEVTEVAWFTAAELADKLAYADERRLAHRAKDILPRYARAEKQAGKVTPR